jgi:hypothetical protein
MAGTQIFACMKNKGMWRFVEAIRTNLTVEGGRRNNKRGGVSAEILSCLMGDKLCGLVACDRTTSSGTS